MEFKTLKDMGGDADDYAGGCGGWVVDTESLREEATKWIKKIKSMKYAEKFCLNCMEIYGGGNNGIQYCPKCKAGEELRWLEQQTASSIGAVGILMKFLNISEGDL